ncbi:MAG TPA: hypothetical protein PK867_22490 [Pirellulales bacterium]|nr:hypothetical protein [Pirellulales bacterium]
MAFLAYLGKASTAALRGLAEHSTAARAPPTDLTSLDAGAMIDRVAKIGHRSEFYED